MPNPATVRERRLRKSKAQLIDVLESFERRVAALQVGRNGNASAGGIPRSSDDDLANQEPIAAPASAAAEAQLRTDQMMQGVLDASPIGSSFAGKDGTIIYANKRLAELFGGTVEEVLATNAREFYFSADDRDALFSRAMPGEQLQNVEVQFKRFDGSGFWGLFSLSHIEPEGEDAYYGSIYDITELNEARQEIEHARDKAAESEARLREAINSISEGFVTFDAEDRRIICNEQYKNMFPLVADKFVPGTLFEEIIDTAISRGHYYLDEDPDDTKRIIGAALM